jgi:hypothetical protein
LGSDWGLFEKNKMATGFYEWQLSNPVFSEVDYFENVVRIDKAFAEDTPEVIIDEENKMISVFKRIPTLQTLYSRQGDIYLRKLPGH